MEVTGTRQAHQRARQLRRDRYLARWGIVTLRIPATDFLGNLQGVVDHIVEFANKRPLRQR